MHNNNFNRLDPRFYLRLLHDENKKKLSQITIILFYFIFYNGAIYDL